MNHVVTCCVCPFALNYHFPFELHRGKCVETTAMPDNDELPWPRCLGTFDEESCRFFLHDLGKRIVPFYPFSFGMEEVYTSVVDKYGIPDCTDAIAVLQELLEDDQNADGVGDDGDIWRSWRHGWRHRNVGSCSRIFTSTYVYTG